jgi:hypothetical protein
VTLGELTVLLPVAAFVALALGVLIVLRRAGSIVARTREVDVFRSAVRDLTDRIDRSLDGAAGRIDAVRRGQVGADTIGETIEAATDAMTRYAEEARALKGPPEAIEIRDALVEDLERAERALGMVDHGAKILAMARRRGRELEAQTSVKRGYLNLIHAREAIARHAAAAEELRVPPRKKPAEATVDAAGERSVSPQESRPDHTM